MTSFALRCVAVVVMLIDHIGYAFSDMLPFSLPFRMVGRIAFPIFCFLIAEGLYHTKNVKKYILRLGIFAVISELPYDAFVHQNMNFMDMTRQNVYFTLLLGLLGILLFDVFIARDKPALSLIAIIAAAAGAWLIQSDYGPIGVFMIFVFYRFRGQPRPLAIFFSIGVLLFSFMNYTTSGLTWALVTLCQLAALPVALSYNGAPGPRSRTSQWAFYAFYPVHMVLLTVIHRIML